MFGCVIDTLGYRDNFIVSYWVGNGNLVAAQFVVEQGGLQEPVGFLADF